MGQRDALHTLIDEIDDLTLDHKALEVIQRGFVVTEDERRELEERFAACNRGEGVEARAFLAKLRDSAEEAARR